MKKIVLTGAAGNLGTVLREPLSEMADALLSTDIAVAPDKLLPNETYVQADIAEMEQIGPLLDGAEMVVHFGAYVDEGPFEKLWGPNYVGAYNIWEAAHRHAASGQPHLGQVRPVSVEYTLRPCSLVTMGQG